MRSIENQIYNKMRNNLSYRMYVEVRKKIDQKLRNKEMFEKINCVINYKIDKEIRNKLQDEIFSQRNKK